MKGSHHILLPNRHILLLAELNGGHRQVHEECIVHILWHAKSTSRAEATSKVTEKNWCPHPC